MTTLILAAIYAGSTHQLDLSMVIVAAAAGSIVGNMIGFWIGRELGYRALLRYGHRVGLTEGRIKLGQYLFQGHGGKIVFFGRFIPLLRMLAALLAGLNCMSWLRFVLYKPFRIDQLLDALTLPEGSAPARPQPVQV